MPDQLQKGILVGPEDGIPDGFFVIYDKAKHLPKISYIKSTDVYARINKHGKVISIGPLPTDIKFTLTHINFGNGRIVIGNTGQVTTYEIDGLEIMVKHGDVLKYPKPD